MFLWFVLFGWEGGGFGFALFFVPLALDKNHEPWSCCILPALLAAIPGKVHLLWERNKDLGEAVGSSSPALLPHPAARERHKPLAGHDLAQDVPFASSRQRKMSFPAPDGSFGLDFIFKSSPWGWVLTPSHEPKCNCVFLSWGKTLGIQMGARIVSWRYFTVNLNGLGIVRLSHLF